MGKYKVTILQRSRLTFIVDAEDAEEAEQEAYALTLDEADNEESLEYGVDTVEGLE